MTKIFQDWILVKRELIPESLYGYIAEGQGRSSYIQMDYKFTEVRNKGVQSEEWRERVVIGKPMYLDEQSLDENLNALLSVYKQCEAALERKYRRYISGKKVKKV